MHQFPNGIHNAYVQELDRSIKIQNITNDDISHQLCPTFVPIISTHYTLSAPSHSSFPNDCLSFEPIRLFFFHIYCNK